MRASLGSVTAAVPPRTGPDSAVSAFQLGQPHEVFVDISTGGLRDSAIDRGASALEQ
jgi:hypothetical protein